MSRIVFLKSGSAKKGGLEKYGAMLIEGFVKKGHQVTLLTSGTVEKEEGFEKISLCKQSKLSYLHLLAFDKACTRWIEQHQPSIVFGLDRNSYQTHYRAGNGVHAAYLLKRGSDEGLFKALSFKINPLHQAILSLEKKTYESPYTRHIFTNSAMVKQEILSHYATPASKITVVHNGVDLEMYQPGKVMPSSKHQFVFIGHGWHRKGLAYLLKALSLIKKSPFHLTVIGKDSHPKIYEELTAQLGLQDRVSFLGAKPSVIPFLQQADSVIIPSTYDPFANVTLEALAMGVFVVTSAFNGAKELIKEENGLIIPDLYDPIVFAQCLKTALDHPKTEESTARLRATILHLSRENQIDAVIERSLV